jgi:hypothetical protein
VLSCRLLITKLVLRNLEQLTLVFLTSVTWLRYSLLTCMVVDPVQHRPDPISSLGTIDRIRIKMACFHKKIFFKGRCHILCEFMKFEIF